MPLPRQVPISFPKKMGHRLYRIRKSEVIGAVKHVDGILPTASIDQIVEVRTDVVDWAAVVVKRCAAVYAACKLACLSS